MKKKERKNQFANNRQTPVKNKTKTNKAKQNKKYPKNLLIIKCVQPLVSKKPASKRTVPKTGKRERERKKRGPVNGTYPQKREGEPR